MGPRHVLTIFAVAELPRAARFYEQAFGWRPSVEVPVYREYTLTGGQRVGLYQREAFAQNPGQAPAQVAPGELTATELYFFIDDVEAATQRVVAAGGRLLSPAATRPWGDEVSYLADPDGNLLALARPLAANRAATSTAPELRALARRWLALWNTGPAELDELHSEHFVDQSPAGRGADRAAFGAGISELRAACPDLEVREEALVIDEEQQLVAVRWSGRGTSRGPLLGLPPTGRALRFTGLELLRFTDGRVTERWGEWDEGALRAQLADAPA